VTFDDVFGTAAWPNIQGTHGTVTATYRSRANPGAGVDLVGILGNTDGRESDDGMLPTEKLRRITEFQYSTEDLPEPATRSRVTVSGTTYSVVGFRKGPVVTVLELQRTTSLHESRRRRV